MRHGAVGAHRERMTTLTATPLPSLPTVTGAPDRPFAIEVTGLVKTYNEIRVVDGLDVRVTYLTPPSTTPSST